MIWYWQIIMIYDMVLADMCVAVRLVISLFLFLHVTHTHARTHAQTRARTHADTHTPYFRKIKLWHVTYRPINWFARLFFMVLRSSSRKRTLLQKRQERFFRPFRFHCYIFNSNIDKIVKQTEINYLTLAVWHLQFDTCSLTLAVSLTPLCCRLST